MVKDINTIKSLLLDLIDWRCNRLANQLDINGNIVGGGFPGGMNGPYQDTETPFRNSAHWLIIFIAAWRLTNQINIKQMALSELKYILDHIPGGQKPYHCRSSDFRDATNGIIGQAWIMESLFFAWKFLSSDDALKEAERIYRIHEFDYQMGAWHTVDLSGNIKKIDGTFNHQLWFASVAALLPKEKVRTDHLNTFMRINGMVPKTVLGGIILHNTRLGPLSFRQLLLKSPLATIKRLVKSLRLINKSIAYHPFNLYAFAGIYSTGMYQNFFLGKKFQQMLSVCNYSIFKKIFFSSKYGSCYNPVGFELAYVKIFFPNQISSNLEQLIHEQIMSIPSFLNIDVNLNKTIDYATLYSRFYELARIVLMEDLR